MAAAGRGQPARPLHHLINGFEPGICREFHHVIYLRGSGELASLPIVHGDYCIKGRKDKFSRISATRRRFAMSEHTSTHIKWHEGLSRESRFELLGTQGATLWFTGLSGSGKSTIATALEKELIGRVRHAYRLDGDNLRHGLNSDLGFSPEDRTENIRRVGEVSVLMADSGCLVLGSFISPYQKTGTKFENFIINTGCRSLKFRGRIRTCVNPETLKACTKRRELVKFHLIEFPRPTKRQPRPSFVLKPEIVASKRLLRRASRS